MYHKYETPDIIDAADWMEEYTADIKDEVDRICFDIGGDATYNLTHTKDE